MLNTFLNPDNGNSVGYFKPMPDYNKEIDKKIIDLVRVLKEKYPKQIEFIEKNNINNRKIEDYLAIGNFDILFEFNEYLRNTTNSDMSTLKTIDIEDIPNSKDVISRLRDIRKDSDTEYLKSISYYRKGESCMGKTINNLEELDKYLKEKEINNIDLDVPFLNKSKSNKDGLTNIIDLSQKVPSYTKLNDAVYDSNSMKFYIDFDIDFDIDFFSLYKDYKEKPQKKVKKEGDICDNCSCVYTSTRPTLDNCFCED